MVTGRNAVFGCAANFLRGKKCVFCGSFKVNRTGRGYVKCRKCGGQKSLKRLRREIAIIQGFYQQVPAYRLAQDLNLDAKAVKGHYSDKDLKDWHDWLKTQKRDAYVFFDNTAVKIDAVDNARTLMALAGL